MTRTHLDALRHESSVIAQTSVPTWRLFEAGVETALRMAVDHPEAAAALRDEIAAARAKIPVGTDAPAHAVLHLALLPCGDDGDWRTH